MRISKRVLWLGAMCAGFWNAPVGAMVPQVSLTSGQDTVETIAQDENDLMPSLPEVEEIGPNPAVPEALLKDRFAKLEKSIPLTYHKSSHEFVEYFIYKKANFTRTMMERMPLYFPLFEKALEDNMGGSRMDLFFSSLILVTNFYSI
jgi:membrane-bound lytic murein transglycosylase D